MKKNYKLIIILESILIFILLSLIIFNYFINHLLNDNSEKLLVEYDNVKIYEIGHPIFFSRSTVKIKYDDYIFETEIANDGAKLSKDNYQIIKKDSFYEVTLKGSEQEDITYYLKYKED